MPLKSWQITSRCIKIPRHQLEWGVDEEMHRCGLSEGHRLSVVVWREPPHAPQQAEYSRGLTTPSHICTLLYCHLIQSQGIVLFCLVRFLAAPLISWTGGSGEASGGGGDLTQEES